jgi:hypothetical protein
MGRGFQMRFDNGYMISVQFGNGNYCDNHSSQNSWSDVLEVQERYTSSNAEVAVIKPDGEFVELTESDDVIGWQSTGDVAELIRYYSQLNINL